MHYDVVVVGGGPAGSAAARDIAQAGLRVAVLEEHQEIGRPVRCAGLISPRTARIAGVSQHTILNKITGAIVTSPGGNRLEIGDGSSVRALVVDRCRFDAELAEDAQGAGAEYWLGSRAMGFERQRGGVCVRFEGPQGLRHVSANLLVGADGSHSRVAKWIDAPAFPEMVRAFGAVARVKANELQKVRIYVGQSVVPNWFGWLVPVADGLCRIGIGVLPGSALTPYRCLQSFIARTKELSGAEVVEYTGGWIPLGFRRRTFADNVMLLGDAAGHVKPTSGGGIYAGQIGARWCAKTAIAALSHGNLDAAYLASYQRGWMAEIGHELRRQRVLRRLFRCLKDDSFDRLLSALDDANAQHMIKSLGDIDFQSALIARLLPLGLPLIGEFLHHFAVALATGMKRPAYSTGPMIEGS